MKNDKFYRYATLALALLNLAVLAFFLFIKPPPRGGQGEHFRKKVVEILQLDAAQNAKFEDMATLHQNKMRDIKGQQRDALKAYFSDLTSTNAEGKPGRSLEQIKDLEAEKVQSTYEHFLEVRSLLTPEQEPLFKEFVTQALDKVLLNPGKRRRPPRKPR